MIITSSDSRPSEGPVLSEVEGPVLSEVEGPVLSEVEGPVLSGPFTLRQAQGERHLISFTIPRGKEMKHGVVLLGIFLLGFSVCSSGWAQEKEAAQKRILMERGEKITGARLDLVRRAIESYQNCRVIAEGRELKGLVINGKTYRDFTLVVRDAKRTIVVATADGVVTFDY